jgi:hypothetical protein
MHHPKLKYHWAHYIPVEHITNQFWRGIQTKILDSLGSKDVFYTASESGAEQRQAAKRLRIVPKRYRRDVDGNPLLRSLGTSRIFHVSDIYNHFDLEVMKRLGTQELSKQEFLYHLVGDLENRASRMRTITARDWHAKVADILVTEMDTPNALQFVKALAVVPLDDKSWIAPSGKDIFFPTLDDIDIPIDLNLKLVDPKALEIPSRNQLFSALGVKNCPPKRVFQGIEDRYSNSKKKSSPPVASISTTQNVNHVKFVYWHHDKLPTDGSLLRLSLISGSMKSFYPTGSRKGKDGLIVLDQSENTLLQVCSPRHNQMSGKNTFNFPT